MKTNLSNRHSINKSNFNSAHIIVFFPPFFFLQFFFRFWICEKLERFIPILWMFCIFSKSRALLVLCYNNSSTHIKQMQIKRILCQMIVSTFPAIDHVLWVIWNLVWLWLGDQKMSYFSWYAFQFFICSLTFCSCFLFFK